ncbi:MAG: sensor domain-containing protein [Anaerolineae bacterium]
MTANDKTWLDALTDGQIIRDWVSLLTHFAAGTLYFSLIMAGYATSIGLSFIVIGIPLLLFCLASTRALAAMDQRLFAALLDLPVPDIADDLDPRGANLFQRIGLYLTSGTTWRSLIYLLLKFPVGIGALMASMFILPFLAFEVLILGPLTIDMRLASVRLLHAIAIGSHKIPGLLLPRGKRKRNRDFNRLQTPEYEDELEPEYYLDDDGEIVLRR